MNVGEYFARFLHFLGILSGNDSTTTAVTVPTTFGISSTPVALHVSYLPTHDETYTPSPKFLASLSHLETTDDSNTKMALTSKGTTFQKDKPTDVSGAGGDTEITEIPSSIGSTGPSEKPSPGSTVPSSETSTGSKGPSSESSPGSKGPSSETSSGSTGPSSEPSSGSTGPSSEPSTGSTGPSSETSTGSTGQSSETSTGGTSPATTQMSPKNGLSKGAVAGIVIGCLLAVALVAAAIVFVVRQKGNPEIQRLRV